MNNYYYYELIVISSIIIMVYNKSCLFVCLFIILLVIKCHLWKIGCISMKAILTALMFTHTQSRQYSIFPFWFMFDYHPMLFFFNIPSIAPIRQRSCYGDGRVCPLYPSPLGWLSASLIQLQHMTAFCQNQDKDT